MTWAESQGYMWSHREPMLQERALSWTWGLCPDGSELTAPHQYQPSSLLFLQSHVQRLCSPGGVFP